MSFAYLLLFSLVLSITTFTFMCIHCSSYIVHDCPVLTITNGMVSYQPPETPPVVGATASYTCNTGYTLSANNMRTCQEVSDGTWTGSDPSCNREFNLTLEAVTHCIGAPYLINGYVSSIGGGTGGQGGHLPPPTSQLGGALPPLFPSPVRII